MNTKSAYLFVGIGLTLLVGYIIGKQAVKSVASGPSVDSLLDSLQRND